MIDYRKMKNNFEIKVFLNKEESGALPSVVYRWMWGGERATPSLFFFWGGEILPSSPEHLTYFYQYKLRGWGYLLN